MMTIQLTIALDGKPIQLSNGLRRIVNSLREYRRRTRSRRMLSEFDDQLLSDIGVSRVDAYREANKPFWRP